MRLGVSGHQKRDGADWAWVAQAIRETIATLPSPVEGWSSLAIGADQLVAEAVLDAGGALVTVIPGPWYESCYQGDDLISYRKLLKQSRTVMIHGLEGEEAYLAAGLEVADACELLLAIWDGEPARGKGGTADVVDYAVARDKPVIQFDPIRRVQHKISCASPARSG